MNMMNNNDNASTPISNLLDELDATETENCDPLYMMMDSMGPDPLISSHTGMCITVGTREQLSIPVRGAASSQALARLAYAQTEFHNTRIRFHAVMRAPKPGSRHHMPLLGPETHLTYVCWIAFHKYVQLHPGWKVRRRSCDDENHQGVANKRKQYCIDAVYTYSPAQKPVAAVGIATATLAGSGSGSNNHIKNVTAASTDNLRPAGVASAATTISPTITTATVTATMDGVLMDSTNVASRIKAAEHKPPIKAMPTMATSAPPAAAAAATAGVATVTHAGMKSNQSPTPTTVNSTNTAMTSHLFRYGDLVSFPVDHLTTPTTLKAIVVRVHPVSEHDDYCGKDENKNKDKDENTQQVTVSTGSGERFIVPIHQLVLIQPLSSTP
jgi:hypothetical protein